MNKWSAAIVLIIFLYLVRSILPPFMVAISLAYLLAPVVNALVDRFHVRQFVVVLGMYLVFVLVAALFISFLEQPLRRETRDLLSSAPQILENTFTQILGSGRLDLLGIRLDPVAFSDNLMASLRDYIGRPTDALKLAERALHTLLDIFLVLVTLFYLLLDSDAPIQFVMRFVPVDERLRVNLLFGKVNTVLRQYIRGQLFLIFLVSAITWIVLQFFFKLHSALPISIATGILEIIPLLGPVVAAIIAAGVAITQGGPGFALSVIVFYTILRQLEDQLVMPNVVGRAVHLHPVITIFAVLAGNIMGGVLGMLLAVPVAAGAKVFLDVWRPTALDVEVPSTRSEA